MNKLYLGEKTPQEKFPEKDTSTGAAQEISGVEIKKFEESTRKLKELKEKVEKKKKTG